MYWIYILLVLYWPPLRNCHVIKYDIVFHGTLRSTDRAFRNATYSVHGQGDSRADLDLSEPSPWTSNGSHIEARQDHFGPSTHNPEPPMPRFRDWPTVELENWAKSSYWEMIALATAGLRAVTDCNTPASYHHYFQEEERDAVRGVLENIVGNGRIGPPEALQENWGLTIKFDWFAIASPEDEPICINTRVAACLNVDLDGNGNPTGAAIYICPFAIKFVAKPLRQHTCDELSDDMDDSLDTLGSVLLHEFTHWDVLTHNLDITRVGDYGSWRDREGKLLPVMGFPPTEYGAWYAQELNRAYDPSILGKRGSENAANYAYFCLEAYWEQACPGKVWEDIRSDLDPEAPSFNPGKNQIVCLAQETPEQYPLHELFL
jgi:hypothetical protein